jgi:hypothetical protein
MKTYPSGSPLKSQNIGLAFFSEGRNFFQLFHTMAAGGNGYGEKM